MGSKENLIAYIEQKSGMNIPEWLREAIMECPTDPNQSETPTRCDHTAEVSKKVDLIDRRAAIDAIRGWVNKALEDWGYAGTEIQCFNAIYPLIKALPSAQPELIKQCAYVRGFEQGKTQGMINAKQSDHFREVSKMVSFTEKERGMLKRMRTLHNGTYADLLDRLVASAQEDADSAYTEGYTAAESKYRQIWDEMQCSECGAVRKNVAFMENFCPNCGARLVQEGEEDV